jgi:hypothetical protein
VNAKPLTVCLPVCPEPGCRQVGKVPVESFHGRSYCKGAPGSLHPKRRMVPRYFKEVRSKQVAA